jgi:membrane-bound lytic murein transglycosylase D
LPQELSFAGEAVPLDQTDIRERMDREIHTNIYWNTNTVFLFKRAKRWLNQIEPILEKNGIPNDFKYLPIIESSLRNDRSPKGAVGFWQILKDTGKEFGLETNSEVDQRYDPLKSTEIACKYLNRAYTKFGNWTAVAASYNVGVRGFSRRMLQQKAGSYYDLLLNEETSRYVFRILALKEIMENPERYGYRILDQQLYNYPNFKEVEINESVGSLVDFALENGISYKTLKLYNPWLRKTSLTIKKQGKSYTIRIPQNPPPLGEGEFLLRDSSATPDDTAELRISDSPSGEVL